MSRAASQETILARGHFHGRLLTNKRPFRYPHEQSGVRPERSIFWVRETGGLYSMGARKVLLVRRSCACMTMLFCLSGMLLLVSPPAGAAAALPELLWQVPESSDSGSGAGQLVTPEGAASNPSTGHVYVPDFATARVNEFDAWGQFVQAWGWDVAPEGAPGDTGANEV